MLFLKIDKWNLNEKMFLEKRDMKLCRKTTRKKRSFYCHKNIEQDIIKAIKGGVKNNC